MARAVTEVAEVMVPDLVRLFRSTTGTIAGMALCAGLFVAFATHASASDTDTPATTAAVTDPSERVECNAVAVIVSGRRVPGFEATARGPDGASACQEALRLCQGMLEDARTNTGLGLPSAECQPLETVQLIPDPIEPATNVAGGAESTADGETARVDPSCNITVCSRRYRSFRANDCTFQPYNGPRRRCRF